VYDGSLTAKVREMFSGLVRRAYQQLVNDMINERLTSAMVTQPPQESAEAQGGNETQHVEAANKVITTQEEHEGFYLVKAILRRSVEPKRVVMRDTQSYCGVLLDDNNRKPICRLHFNGKQKYLGLFKADKSEERVPIASIDDIYAYTDRLRETVSFYGGPEATA
jgi:hypothetical protein